MVSLLPLHHPGQVESSNFIQRFIDSEIGVFIASLTHTAGAMLFTAGIALYLYVAHLIRKGTAEKAVPDLGLLNYAHGFTLAGIALNGLGGVSRLKQGDHPGLEMLGDSLWVQVLLVKHLFLVVGVGLAVYLTWRTRGFRRKARVDFKALERESPRMIGFALGSFFTILIATVFGVVASMAFIPPPGGMDGMDPDATGNGTQGLGVLAGPHTYTGSLSGMPNAPATLGNQRLFDEHAFTVPEGADLFQADLEWATAEYSLVLTVFNPEGRTVGESKSEATKYSVTVAGEDVTPGRWLLRVQASQALNEAYTLTAQAVRTGGANSLVNMVEVAPGDIWEINLLMEVGDTVNFEWALMDSPEAIYFDIHLHNLDTGQDEFPVQGEWNTLNGNYTKQSEIIGPSFLWENKGSAPVMVHYQLLGQFQVQNLCNNAGCQEA